MGSRPFVRELTVPLDSRPPAVCRGHARTQLGGFDVNDHSSFSLSLPVVFLLAAITASSCASSQATGTGQAAPAKPAVDAKAAPAAKPAGAAPAQSAAGKPNIVVIMGDDIGMWNIGAYHRGMMAGRTPNLDK